MASLQSVDQRRDVAGAESVIDVDHADIRGARVEHAEQGGDSFEGRAVADAGGHGDDGDADQASDNAGQSAFHAGANNDDARPGQGFAVGQQAMNAGDSDVVKMFDFVAHEFGGDDGFFGDRDVAGSGGDHGDDALAVLHGIALQNDGARELAKFRGANFFLDRCKLLFVGPRGQDIAPVFGEAREDFCDLSRSLAFSEDDFGHADAQGTVMIDFGEAEIFERHMAQARDRIVGLELALSHLFEKLADGFGVHTGLNIQDSRLSIQGSASSPPGEV